MELTNLALIATWRAVSPLLSAAVTFAFFSNNISTMWVLRWRTARKSGVSPSKVLASYKEKVPLYFLRCDQKYGLKTTRSGFVASNDLTIAVWFLSIAQWRHVLPSFPLISTSAYFLIKASTMFLWPPLPLEMLN